MSNHVTIVGMGLAGCTVAWQLHFRGLPFSFAEDQPTAAGSLVAAGMLCPVTGKAFNPSWRIDEFYAPAREFYTRVEEAMGLQLWHDYPVVRLFFNAKDRAKFEQKRADSPSLNSWLEDVIDHVPNAIANHGAVIWRGSGRVNVRAFVQGTRTYFSDQLSTQETASVPSRAASVPSWASSTQETASVPSWASSTQETASVPSRASSTQETASVPSRASDFDRKIYTTGARGLIKENPSALPHRSAKGEILTVRIPGLREDQIISRGTWIVPTGMEDQTFLCGANYDWDQLDNVPTAAGRQTVEEGLRTLINLPYEVIDHNAGVRPIVRRSEPVVGQVPDGYYLNGLGSKGTLYAPQAVDYLLEAIYQGKPVPDHLQI